MRTPPTLYRSGIVRRLAHRAGPCADCGGPVHHRRPFEGPADDVEARIARWQAETLRCLPCARAWMRAQAGVP